MKKMKSDIDNLKQEHLPFYPPCLWLCFHVQWWRGLSPLPLFYTSSFFLQLMLHLNGHCRPWNLHYCSQCEQVFCDDCKLSHLRSKISRSHIFLSGTNINTEKKVGCTDHGEDFIYLCEDCDQLICRLWRGLSPLPLFYTSSFFLQLMLHLNGHCRPWNPNI
jgi:hypothetical protein